MLVAASNGNRRAGHFKPRRTCCLANSPLCHHPYDVSSPASSASSATPTTSSTSPAAALPATLVLSPVFVQLLLAKRRIRHPQVTRNAVIHHRQNHVLVPLPDLGVEVRSRLWRVPRCRLQESAELLESRRHRLARVYYCDAEVWDARCGLLKRGAGFPNVPGDAEVRMRRRWIFRCRSRCLLCGGVVEVDDGEATVDLLVVAIEAWRY